MKTFRHVAALAATLLFALMACQPAQAQSQLPSDNHSRSIATGNTYQTLAPATGSRRTLEVENNNATDNCLIDVTGTVPVGATTSTSVTTADNVSLTAAKASILLIPGGSYTRYYPSTPLGPIVGTCTTSGDSIYVDAQ